MKKKIKKLQMVLAAMLGVFALVYPGCQIERQNPGVDAAQITKWHQEFQATYNAEMQEIRATGTADAYIIQVESNRLGTLAAEMFGTPEP